MNDSVRARYYKAIFMLVTLLVFTDEMFYGTIVPLIPVYTKMLHLTSLTMGEIFAAYAIGLLLFSIPMGLIAQRCGYKRVFICGMASLALSCVLFGFINSPVMLFLGRLVQGISGAATWNAGFAVCARMYPKHQGQKIGVLMAVVGVGTISGPPIGGMLYELFGFHLMFIVLACFCLIQVLLLSFVHFGSLDNHPKNSARVSLRAVVGNQRLMWFCLIFIICTCSFGMLEVIIPNYMSVKFAANSFIIGLLFGIMGLCNAGSDCLFGILSDRYGFMPFIFWGIIASALIVPCLALAPGIGALFVAMVMFGSAAGAAVTPGQPFVYQIVHDDPVLDASGGGGFAYGLMNSCYSIGLIVGPVVGGALNRYYGFLCSLLIYSGVLFISVIIFYSKVVHYSDKK